MHDGQMYCIVVATARATRMMWLRSRALVRLRQVTPTGSSGLRNLHSVQRVTGILTGGCRCLDALHAEGVPLHVHHSPPVKEDDADTPIDFQ